MGGPNVDYAGLDALEGTGLKELQDIFTSVTKRTDIRLTSCSWRRSWRPNIRMAEKFQVGRVFLGGGAYFFTRWAARPN